MVLRAALRMFVECNKWLSRRFDRLLPEKFQVDGLTHFRENFAPSHIPAGALVYDVGGGKHPFHTAAEKARLNLRVVGLDIDERELAHAPRGAYDEVIRADITQYRGRENASVVICQALLEHVPDTATAFAGLASLLRKGGVALLFVPSKNAFFARVNLLIPEGLKRRMLRFLYPEVVGNGFPSYYDRCTLPMFEEMARAQGLDVVEKRAYYRSQYLIFLTPVHILWRCWLCAFQFVAKERAAETFSVALRKK